MYQLIALDMDGTLLNQKQEITVNCQKAINKAIQQGYHVVLSTGRSLTELQPYMDILKTIRYFILENGAVVYDQYHQRIMYQKTLTSHQIDKINQVYQQQDIMPHLFINGYSYTTDRAYHMNDYQMGQYQDMFLQYVHMIKDFPLFLQEHQNEIEKWGLYHQTSKQREISIGMLKDASLSMTKVEQTSLEITSQGVNKGEGLKQLCLYLNIPLNQCIAVGDSDNDLEILACVGLPIAMKNANEHVYKIAKAVVLDHNHDGVKEAIEKYLLGENHDY